MSKKVVSISFLDAAVDGVGVVAERGSEKDLKFRGRRREKDLRGMEAEEEQEEGEEDEDRWEQRVRNVKVEREVADAMASSFQCYLTGGKDRGARDFIAFLILS